MSRRAGVTLVEVLVAIFVMGIGMIALLTLFPIGMLRMGRAIHDQRSLDSERNAFSVALANNLGNDIDVVSDRTTPYNATTPSDDLFQNPLRNAAVTGAPVLLDADPYGESYPVFVDPIGFYNLPVAAGKHWVGNILPSSNIPPVAAQPKGALRRRPAEFVRNGLPNTAAGRTARNLRIFQSCTLWDDLVFEHEIALNPGTPQSTGGTIFRDARFSWGYTMWRPLTQDKGVVDCSVVVFDSRSLAITVAV